MADDIKNKLPIGGDAKKLDYVGMFMEHMEVRAKNGKIVPKRVVVVRRFAEGLEKFAEEHKNPTITKLPSLYEKEFENGEIKFDPSYRATTYRKKQKQRGQLPPTVLRLLTRTRHSLNRSQNELYEGGGRRYTIQTTSTTPCCLYLAERLRTALTRRQWSWMCVRHHMLMNGIVSGHRSTQPQME